MIRDSTKRFVALIHLGKEKLCPEAVIKPNIQTTYLLCELLKEGRALKSSDGSFLFQLRSFALDFDEYNFSLSVVRDLTASRL